MDSAIIENLMSPFPILGESGCTYHFLFLSIEGPVSKQCRPWSDALFCGVWSGTALFAKVPVMDARLCVKIEVYMVCTELQFLTFVVLASQGVTDRIEMSYHLITSLDSRFLNQKIHLLLDLWLIVLFMVKRYMNLLTLRETIKVLTWVWE